MKKRFLSVIAMTFYALVAQGQTYDVSHDFSLDSNPNGVWSYGWSSTLGGTFSLLTSKQTLPTQNGVPHQIWSLTPSTAPAVKHNATTNTATSDGTYGVYPPGTTWFTAGENGAVHNFGIIRFTVPAGAGGDYRIVSSVRPYLDGLPSNDSDFYVLRNGTQIHGENVPPNSTRGYSNVVTLAAGDVVDFVVGRGLDGLNQGLKIQATLDAVSPPPPSRTFDIGEDFSLASNPNGVWSYGWSSTLGGAFSLLTSKQTLPTQNGVPHQIWSLTPSTAPAVKHNATTNTATSDGTNGVYPPGTTWFTAGENGAVHNFGIIRFTVPAGGGGDYRIASSVRPYLDGPPSNDSDFYVLRNGTQLHGENVPPNSTRGYSNVVTLAAGDVVDFVVGRGLDGLNQGLKIQATLNIASSPPPSPTFDIGEDFSLASNPNGVWSYGWKGALNGSFTLLTAAGQQRSDNGVLVDVWSLTPNTAPAVYHNGTTSTATSDGGLGVYPPGTTWFYAGQNGTPQNFGVIRLTVPTGGGGTYRLESSVRPHLNGPPGNDNDYFVFHNATQLHSQNVPLSGSGGYSNTVALSAGDTIDFVVGRGTDGVNSGLKINALIRLVGTNEPPPPPPPSTFDIGEDFSLASNPNGVWSYGWKGALNGSFNLLTAAGQQRAENGVLVDVWSLTPNTAPAVYHNGTTSTATSDGGLGVYPPGTTWFYAGQNGAPQNFGVIRLTVPTGGGGTYRLESSVRPHLNGPPGNDNDYFVFHNATQLHAQNVPLFGSGGYSNTVALSAGDTIDFVVGRGTDGVNSGLKIQAALTRTDGPPVNNPPTAKAAISPVVDLSPKLTNRFVISANGSSATVTLDGSQSSDPEGAALTHEWFVDGSATPVATGVNATVSLAVGSHEITLVVDDGQHTDSDTVEVEVITIDDMLSILVVLVDETGLPRKSTRPLITTLKQAQHAGEGDRARAAINKLEQFQQKVAAQVTPINAECAEVLIDAAQKVIDALSAP